MPERRVILPSVLDRLTGTVTGRRTHAGFGVQLEDLRQAVRRDLEWLLNTHRPLEVDPERYPEASTSVLTYGLPDLSSRSGTSSSDLESVAALMADAIRNHESRLIPSSVRVEPLPAGESARSAMSFRITGVLRVETIREPVRFDSTIDPDAGGIRVEAVF